MDRFDRDESPVREHSDEGAYHDNLDRNGAEHRSKDRKGRSRGDDKDHRSKDRKDLEKDRKERRKEDRDERDKERSKDRERHRDRDKDRKEKEPERDREMEKERGKDKSRDREIEKERGKDKSRDKEKERDKAKDKEREKGREKHKDREKERESEKDREREKAREKSREKGREMEIEKERSREREHVSKKAYEEDYTRNNSNALKFDNDDDRDRDINKEGRVSFDDKDLRDDHDVLGRAPGVDVQDRILKVREERLKKKSEAVSEVLAWVSKSRKLEEKKNVEKQKALQLSKIFEEQDNIVQGESDDEEGGQHNKHDLAGVKVLHGLEKVMEGGAVVLTLQDQNILAEGDINEDVDVLENVEIGEQKRRDEAYKAAKKKTGIYDDKFNDDPSSEKKILPQYDDPAAEEGLTLDAKGRFTGEAEKKLEELRRRIQGVATTNRLEDLSSSAKVTSDYYTHEEMLQFKKPKKKKAIRKKEKLNLDALEAEAVSAGLGVGDLGSRNDGRRQAIREEQERSEAEMKSKAYQSAYAKADEAIKSLRMEQTVQVKLEDEDPIVADDDQDLYKSLERARKLALKKQEEASSGPEAIARAATTAANSQPDDDQNTTSEESQENKVVFTELQEFVWGLPLGEEAHKLDRKDVFTDEDEGPRTSDQEMKDEPGGWTEVVENEADENPATGDKEEIVPDETIHEVAVGKGLSGVLQLLKDRGTLKEGIEWGGRNMDKKKSKLVGIVDDSGDTDRFKDIRIERTDEFGRIMTPKEAFRMISHKFHGKGPGKMKQEKRMKQYQEELKLKQMKNSDTPTESVERMREAQARLKTPYLVLSGHVKPGQTSDPRSGFATVEKDLPGGLTPMLGNRKVEHFLGIKRKSEAENTNSPKKPKS